MDYDRIMVMSVGEMVEYDTPFNLLENGDSALSALAASTGEANCAHLKELAKTAHQMSKGAN
jgi:hypothetical protein